MLKFDKVWHKGRVYKLKLYGISSNLLTLIENYFLDCKQKVVVNGQTSFLKRNLSGIPQGLVLGSLLS